MSRRRPCAVVFVGILLVGCGDGDDSASPPATTTTSTSSTTTSTSSSTTSSTTVAITSTVPPTPTSTMAARAPLPPPTTVPATVLATGFQGVLDRFAATQPVPFAMVAVDLVTGARGARLADRQVLSASLYKLWVAEELLRRIAAGELDPNRPAAGRTVDQCIDDMIVVSDNACGVAGLDIIGRGAHDARLRADGYPRTSMATPQRTSADDVARFLGLARARGGRLYGLLQRQQVRDRLPTRLPAGTPIAHKTGDRIGWAHDAGVVTTPRGDLLVVVLSGQWVSPCCDADRPGPAEARAFGAIAEVGRLLYEEASAGR